MDGRDEIEGMNNNILLDRGRRENDI